MGRSARLHEHGGHYAAAGCLHRLGHRAGRVPDRDAAGAGQRRSGVSGHPGGQPLAQQHGHHRAGVVRGWIGAVSRGPNQSDVYRVDALRCLAVLRVGVSADPAADLPSGVQPEVGGGPDSAGRYHDNPLPRTPGLQQHHL